MDTDNNNNYMKNNAKGWIVSSLAEFVGTAMFLYLAVGGADAVTQGVGPNANPLGVAFAFGFGLIVTAWAFFRVSGSHFNPAISLSSLITGHLTVPKFILYFIAQILGAMVGIALARGTTPSNQSITQINQLRNGQSIARGFFLEFFLTTILCFVYHMTVHEKNRSTFMAALPYGLTLFSCYLFATSYTNAAINPARAFGTSVVARSFSREHWIFWFGPLGGAILAAALHILFRYMDYDQYAPGIDAENQAQYMRAQAAYNNDGTGAVNPAYNQGGRTIIHPDGSTAANPAYNQGGRTVVHPDGSTAANPAYNQGGRNVVNPDGSTVNPAYNSDGSAFVKHHVHNVNDANATTNNDILPR